MAEPKYYSSLTEIYIENMNNPTFVLLLIVGCITFYSLQKRGERAHSNLVTDKRKKKMSKELFGTYFQSVLHAPMVSISSYVIFFKFRNRLSELEIMDENDDDYFYVILYKVSAVLSISYFIILTPYELFGINQTTIFRIVMSIHHIAGILGQSLVFVTNPIFVFVSAIILQCELSTIFLNIRALGFAMDNSNIFFIGGLGALITYPLTRIVFFVYTIYKTYCLMDRIILHIGYQALCLIFIGEIFVLCMSSGYTYMIFKDYRKIIIMDTNRNKTKEQ